MECKRVTWGRWLVGIVGLSAALTACGTGADRAGQPEPIAECQAYERAFAACEGRQVPIASNVMALATSQERREQIRALCVWNSNHLKTSCSHPVP